jgi:hypothetical protein
MKLYLVDGEDLLHRAGPFQTILVLAHDEPDARDLVDREAKGFRIDHVEFVRDYPQLAGVRPALIARITCPTPTHVCDAPSDRPGAYQPSIKSFDPTEPPRLSEGQGPSWQAGRRVCRSAAAPS